jgi:hypothetical protein
MNCVKVHQVGSRVLKWCPSDVASRQETRCFADVRQPSLKVKYWEINVELGRTGAGLAIEDIMAQLLHKDRLGV